MLAKVIGDELDVFDWEADEVVKVHRILEDLYWQKGIYAFKVWHTTRFEWAGVASHQIKFKVFPVHLVVVYWFKRLFKIKIRR